MPHFVTQRSLYEVRERPSKTYAWQAFMLANITAELPWNSLMSVIIFLGWYYPIGLYRNAEPTGEVAARGGLAFLFLWAFLLFTSTFTHMIIAGIPTAETGGNIGMSPCFLVVASHLTSLRSQPVVLFDPRILRVCRSLLSRGRDLMLVQYLGIAFDLPALLDIHVSRIAVHVPRERSDDNEFGEQRRGLLRH